LPGSIFKDHLVNNLSTVDASPTEEMFLGAIKFFKSHDTVATGTFHLSLLKTFGKYAHDFTKGSGKVNRVKVVFY
jgi:hypothetical protein